MPTPPAKFASEWGTRVPRHGDVAPIVCPQCGGGAVMELVGSRCYGSHDVRGACGWTAVLSVRSGRIDDPSSR